MSTVVVTLALAAAGAAGSASTDFNPDGFTITAVEGNQFSGVVAHFVDKGGPPKSSYHPHINWGDGITTDGSIDGLNSKNEHDVTGSHTYNEEGIYEVRITINGGSGTGSTSPRAIVSDAPLAVTVAVPGVTEGGSVSGVVATFTDGHPGEVVGAHTATIGWGDGTSSTGAIARPNPGTFTVAGTHTFGEEGQFTVTVRVDDKGGATATGTQSVTVTDAPLTAGAPIALHSVEGKPVPSGVVSKFTDGYAGAPMSDFTATINWGDGKTTPGTVSAVPGGGFQVTGGPHTYGDQGRFQTSVAVKDKGGSSVNVIGAAIIGDAPIRAKGVQIEAHIGKPFRGTIATFVDGNAKAPLADYTVRIDWGNGPKSFGTVLRSRTGLVVTGQHTWGRLGRKTLTITIVDRGGSRATATSRAQVS